MGQELNTTRRQFLLASAAIAASGVGGKASAADGDSVLLRPSGQNDLFRVRLEMEVAGNINVPENALVSRKSRMKLPLESKAVFDYEERLRLPKDADPASPITFAERYYHEAKSAGTVNQRAISSQLRPAAREVVVRRETLPEVIYSVDDYFKQPELELLRVPAASVAVDQLLPTEAVSQGSVYSPSGDAIGSVLNLTAVDANEVSITVTSISEATATMELKGKVDASVDGVPTVIRLIGKLTFDRTLGTCTWFALGLHETREISKSEPGFDIQATVKLLRRPLDNAIALSPKPAPINFTQPVPADRLYVELGSKSLQFNAMMPRQWRMMKDVPGSAMMRMIDSDRSIAQCDVRPLAALSPGQQWTLEAFQEDVQRTLGEQLSELIEADQRVSDSGLRVLRITAAGSVLGVPIQWVLMHFSDDSGRRLLATFTMEGENIRQFAGSDIQLASSMRLDAAPTPSPESETAVSSAEPSTPAARTASRNPAEEKNASE